MTVSTNTDPGSNGSREQVEAQAAPAGFMTFLKSWRYFLLLLCLAIFIGLFYAEENWRGHRAWSKYRQRLATQGVPMEPAAVIPKAVPLSENFASTPLLNPLFDFLPGTQRWRNTNASNIAQSLAPGSENAQTVLRTAFHSPSNSWASRIDLIAAYAALQDGNKKSKGKANSESSSAPQVSSEQAAAGILEALANTDAVIEELREASRRPYCRFDIQYDTDDPAAILLPHLAVLGRLTEILQLRALAELTSGRVEESAHDVELMLYLADATRDEPIMVSQMVRMRQARHAIQCIAEGMGRWSEPQLQSFQERLQRFDFCAGMQRAVDAERVFFGGGMIDFVHQHPEMYSALVDSGTGSDLTFPGALWAGAPGGWFDLEKLNYHVAFDRYRVAGLDLTNHLITPAAVDVAESRMTGLRQRPWPLLFVRHKVFSALMLPGFSGAFRKTAFAQTGVNIAGIACAVERYRLQNGEVCESLDMLTKARAKDGASNAVAFLSVVPHDIINGQPLKYRREAGGRYVLYSVGWNGVDDGGTNVTTKGEGEIPLQGDWIWRPF